MNSPTSSVSFIDQESETSSQNHEQVNSRWWSIWSNITNIFTYSPHRELRAPHLVNDLSISSIAEVGSTQDESFQNNKSKDSVQISSNIDDTTSDRVLSAHEGNVIESTSFAECTPNYEVVDSEISLTEEKLNEIPNLTGSITLNKYNIQNDPVIHIVSSKVNELGKSSTDWDKTEGVYIVPLTRLSDTGPFQRRKQKNKKKRNEPINCSSTPLPVSSLNIPQNKELNKLKSTIAASSMSNSESSDTREIISQQSQPEGYTQGSPVKLSSSHSSDNFSTDIPKVIKIVNTPKKSLSDEGFIGISTFKSLRNISQKSFESVPVPPASTSTPKTINPPLQTNLDVSILNDSRGESGDVEEHPVSPKADFVTNQRVQLDSFLPQKDLVPPNLVSQEIFAAARHSIQRVFETFPVGKKFHNGYRQAIFAHHLSTQKSKNESKFDSFCSPEYAKKRKTSEYEILGVLGKGSHGIVYLAHQISQQNNQMEESECFSSSSEKKALALKIIDFNDSGCNIDEKSNYYGQLLHEAYILHSCEHPNIVKYHESFCWPPSFLIVVLEHISGGSLKQFYKKHGPIPENIIARVMRDILSSLKYLHNECFSVRIHRDIKASNILFNETGDSKLIDFGVCRELTETSRCYEFVGTPQWMAPEVIDCHRGYNCSADIWSLGITAYELACGQLPWPKRITLSELLKLITHGNPPRLNLNEGFDKEFCFFLERCLQQRATKRATADELLNHPFIQKYCDEKLQVLPTLEQMKKQTETTNEKRKSTGIVHWLLPFLRKSKAKKTKPTATNLNESFKSTQNLENQTSCTEDKEMCEPQQASLDKSANQAILEALDRDQNASDDFNQFIDKNVDTSPPSELLKTLDDQCSSSEFEIDKKFEFNESGNTSDAEKNLQSASDTFIPPNIDSKDESINNTVQDESASNEHFHSRSIETVITNGESVINLETFNSLLESPTLEFNGFLPNLDALEFSRSDSARRSLSSTSSLDSDIKHHSSNPEDGQDYSYNKINLKEAPRKFYSFTSPSLSPKPSLDATHDDLTLPFSNKHSSYTISFYDLFLSELEMSNSFPQTKSDLRKTYHKINKLSDRPNESKC